MKKCVIIMNPESGKKKKINTYEVFYDILRKYGYEAEIILTKARGDGEKIIQSLSEDIDLVICAGGDGTLNEVVAGNLKRDIPLTLAPLPMGSTNDVGLMYGLDQNVLENLDAILNGEEKKVDICFINHRPFVYVACFGDYIDLAYATPRSLKSRYGNLAYILYGVRQLRNKIHQYHIKYRVDGCEYSGEYSFLFISNSSRIAGQPDVYYDVKLNDNMFEVALAKVKDKKEMLRMLVLINTIDVKDIPNITYYRCNHFEVEFLDRPKTSWCIDGEELKDDSSTFVFQVHKRMKMMLPRENLEKLFDEV